MLFDGQGDRLSQSGGNDNNKRARVRSIISSLVLESVPLLMSETVDLPTLYS